MGPIEASVCVDKLRCDKQIARTKLTRIANIEAFTKDVIVTAIKMSFIPARKCLFDTRKA